MKKSEYCLAKDPFGYYVYGSTEDIFIFLRPNQDISWKLEFYFKKEDLLKNVKKIDGEGSIILIDLL